jgi:hypothetical protein
MGDFISMAQYRGELSKRNPHFHTGLARKVVGATTRLPRLSPRRLPFVRPNILDRFFWQSMYAIQGSRGRYSGGPSLTARKREG